MDEALAHAIPIGLAVALSPFPIIAIVLILAVPGGLARGLAFLGGALAGVSAAGALVLALESRADPTEAGDPATWISVAKLVLAGLLVALALGKWRGRPPPGGAPKMPGWMAATESLSAPRAALMGVLLSGVNPKNLVLIVAAATSIAGAAEATGAQIAALLVFVSCACLGVALPVVATALWGDRAAGALGGVRAWMLRHHTLITVIIVASIAAKLAIDAIGTLAGG
jgi:threonine/homoserine/homoserine lactone efflux protein